MSIHLSSIVTSSKWLYALCKSVLHINGHDIANNTSSSSLSLPFFIVGNRQYFLLHFMKIKFFFCVRTCEDQNIILLDKVLYAIFKQVSILYKIMFNKIS